MSWASIVKKKPVFRQPPNAPKVDGEDEQKMAAPLPVTHLTDHMKKLKDQRIEARNLRLGSSSSAPLSQERRKRQRSSRHILNFRPLKQDPKHVAKVGSKEHSMAVGKKNPPTREIPRKRHNPLPVIRESRKTKKNKKKNRLKNQQKKAERKFNMMLMKAVQKDDFSVAESAIRMKAERFQESKDAEPAEEVKYIEPFWRPTKWHFGRTPLHLAAMRNSPEGFEIFKLLLMKGFDMYQKDKDGFTALDYCIFNSPPHFQIIAMIMRYNYHNLAKVFDDHQTIPADLVKIIISYSWFLVPTSHFGDVRYISYGYSRAGYFGKDKRKQRNSILNRRDLNLLHKDDSDVPDTFKQCLAAVFGDVIQADDYLNIGGL